MVDPEPRDGELALAFHRYVRLKNAEFIELLKTPIINDVPVWVLLLVIPTICVLWWFCTRFFRKDGGGGD
jgi:hypothetical protein